MTEEIYDYQDISQSFNNYLLFGNGLSISINQNFSYQTLLAECQSLEDENHERVLSDDDLNFFEQFETIDFERVLYALNTSKIVNNIVGLETGEIEKRYENIKNALVKVVRKVHPSWDEFEDSKFLFLNEYLQKFQGIFTTNYDLILYWSLMRNIEPFIDFFFQGEFDTTNVDNWSRRIPFYFLHGSLHLFREKGVTKKLRANGLSILDRFDQTMVRGRTPLFVSEGTYTQKLQSITTNDYLNFCFYQLKGIEKNITIFGHSLSENDKHIADAINNNPNVTEVAFGIYVGNAPNEKHINYECARINKLFGEKKVYFFNSETLWNLK
ncbi:DUF4917 family protein [Bacillus sp. ISL-7]|uniref:DUF4917 family protein n=1 Tax=Bacillus sp. ISL-7 TaxID=2819136 RepID=UPI001BE7783C|nr:DUF4917 family protein [Bacillus sp. ISL-7]MBT2736212.1 DUF4917 family protein [Bacillus sp. ISL-7]